jgi:hypothetical protein
MVEASKGAVKQPHPGGSRKLTTADISARAAPISRFHLQRLSVFIRAIRGRFSFSIAMDTTCKPSWLRAKLPARPGYAKPGW